MNFEWALTTLKSKKYARVRRVGWEGYVSVMYPGEEEEMMGHPYLYSGLPLVPWQPTQIDLFAEDWELAL